jgi:hydroxyacylglutathione hydrolase
MPIDFHAGAPIAGDLDVQWVHGSRSRPPGEATLLQVHAYDAHTFILRQHRSVSTEAPFLYLLFGNERALLLDTGATKDPERFPLRRTIDGLIERWLADNPRDTYGLVVAHTHGHGDHVAGDSQFVDRPDTTVVDRGLEGVQSFFRFSEPAAQTVQLDLGGRVLEVTGSPGHHPAAITIYDPWSGFLLTGDNVYPGRLYARDMEAFVTSLRRTVEFAESRTVTHIMGCHIEMSRTPRHDYPIGAANQPDEPPLQMTVSQLRAVRDAAASVAARPGVHVFDDFIIYNGPCRLGLAKLILRGLASKVLRR